MFRLLLITFCLIVPTYCFTSTGLLSDFCGNTNIAQHQALSPASFPVMSFHLRLSGSGEGFSGFVVEAQDANGAPVGKFKIVERNKSKTLACKTLDDTIMHTETSQGSPIESVDFTWVPVGYQGNVRFVATVATDEDQCTRRVLKEINV